MSRADLAELVVLLALCAAVAAYGEPRPLGLIVGGAAAVTVVFAALRKLDR